MNRDAWTIHEPIENERSYWPDVIYVGLAAIAFITTLLIMG